MHDTVVDHKSMTASSPAHASRLSASEKGRTPLEHEPDRPPRYGDIIDHAFTLWCFVIAPRRYCSDLKPSWRCLVPNHPVDRRHGRSMSTLTRIVLSLAAVSFVALSGPAKAQTYDPRYPVCMTLYNGPFGGQWIDCSYTSLPQCQASASGRAAMCSINPYFIVRPGERPHVRHRRHVS